MFPLFNFSSNLQVQFVDIIWTLHLTGTQWKWFNLTLGVLNFIALVDLNVQAYKARGININDELAESYNIGLATLSMLQISIAGVPLLVIVYNDPYAYSFVWCGIIFTVCTMILLLMFVRKIKRWKTWSAIKDKKKFTQGGSIQTSGSNVGGAVSDTSKILVSTGSNAETEMWVMLAATLKDELHQ